MTELELYKFINDRGCEWHWYFHRDGIHLVLFVSSYDIKDFCEMLGYNVFDDDGLPCEQRLLHDGSIGLCPFEDVCEYYGICAENVFPRKED